MKLGMYLLALVALLAVAVPVPSDAAESYEYTGLCPTTWPPPASKKANSTFYVAVNLEFTPSTDASCSNPAFMKLVKKQPKQLAVAMLKIIIDHPEVKHMKVLPTTYHYCKDPASPGQPGVISIFLHVPVLKGANQGNPTLSDYDATLGEHEQLVHRADICPKNLTENPYNDEFIMTTFNAFCLQAGAGQRLQSALACVQGAKATPPLGRAACFPGDATMTRADPETGRSLGRARMGDLKIGDSVACLVPAGLEGWRGLKGGFRDDQQTYVPGVCRVFSYLHADPTREASFVVLHYTDAQGRPAKLRASAEHLIYTAPASLAPGAAGGAAGAPAPAPAALSELPPGGATKRADRVQVGDLLAVSAAPDAGAGGEAPLFVARVTEITRESATGIYAPLLTRAGLPLVDGAAAFSWVQLAPGAGPHPMTNLGEYYRHSRLWSDVEAAIASGCEGDACPCLDAPEDPATPCVRVGTRLADVPAGISDYSQRSFQVYAKARAEGRTHADYARGIAFGRAYTSMAWPLWLARAAGVKPHTLGLLATDALLTRPPAAEAS